ncbi:DUF1559 domain-containing protein [Paludisphaera sp.]|uniref:DUF1559 family PulG-like putative transporter n=1 Tax=Paludisphaera sp. TaxID=2017432 RepID=UPI00301C4C04
MKTLSALLLTWGLTACAAASADTKDVVATFVDDRTAMLARIRLDAIAEPGSLGEAEPLAAAYRPWLDALRKAGARELYVVVTLDELPPLPRSSPFGLVPLEEGADAKAIGELLCAGDERGGPAAWTTCASIRGAVLAGDDAALERAKATTPAPRPDFAAAFDSAGEAPIALAFAAPEDLRRAIDEQVVTLPEQLGGGPAKLVSRGLRWASLSYNPGTAAPVRLLARAAGADEAAKLLAAGRKGVEHLRGASGIAEFVPGIGGLVDSLTPRVEGDRVVLELSAQAAGQLARAVVGPVEEDAGRQECRRNLMHIALAMHNYHSQHNSFPPAYSTDADGKPLLSWRVLILPFLDAEDLYKEFRPDEPWDSPHNKALIPRMPKYYACPSTLGGTLAPGTTTYKRPVGAAIGVDPARGLPLHQVTDGTSATIMVLETPADQAVEWTRPGDLEVGEQVDPKSLLGRHVGGANAVMFDGAAHFLPDTRKPTTLRRMLTPSAGEVIEEED